MKETVSVPVHLTPGFFRRFSLFDTFIRQKRWRGPAIFTAILFASGALCLLKGGTLLAAVLWAVALGLPAVYFLSFLHSVTVQCRANQLFRAPLVYTLTFSPEMIQVKSGREEACFQYTQLYAVYRVKDGIYLYVHPAKAFLLPAADIPGGCDALWNALKDAGKASKGFKRA